MSNLFEQAARNKYRFGSSKGLITVEELWDMPLQSKNGFNLDTVAVSLQDQRDKTGKSFVTRSTENSEFKAKLDIVVHIIETKIAEANAKDQDKANKEKKQKLMSILADKEDEGLRNMTPEQIKKELAALN